MRRALLALLLLAGLAGCGTAPDTPQLAAVAPPATSTVLVSAPVAVTIPAIGAHSTLIPLDLTATGELATPDVHQPMQAGWYAGGVVPGAVGPSVVIGHVDGEIAGRKGQPGIFYRLHELKPGDDIQVARADGSVLRFRVYRVKSYPKDRFPTAEVYGDVVARPELRAITCGGSFDHTARSYRENVVVFAALAA